MKIALTIAGSDSGAGAGIQADLKTFAACGVYGISAVTAVTAQNTQGVFGVAEMKPAFVSKQLFVLMKDIGCNAAKTGMLFSRPIIEAVAAGVRKYKVEPLVVDPVMYAKGGHALLKHDAEQALIALILPQAYLITPNLDEAKRLSGLKKVETVEQMKEAAVKILMLGPRNVLVKGGHLSATADRAVDVLFTGKRFETFESERIDTSSTHGTGCTYSAAITAFLANGREL
ncbi:MAG: bifunctional hydroxymethylpyrimidine kinase/phosphomethylpyrimidine kinase, partial [Candidatus Edwardsbacteria bacterium]|nr:bifunctional hydroxymethylpyrimidine kinase/phosphomethylpyrimidine kinase [Candidatus Edwardsbacteria bacterium]